jgi:integration host factor subunit beta
MTKADLIDEVSRLAELTRKDSEVILETIFDSVVRSLRAGDKIEIRGFGSFRTRQRKPRIGRNPKTGERVEVPAKKIPFFKPSKELKDLVNLGDSSETSGSPVSSAPPTQSHSVPYSLRLFVSHQSEIVFSNQRSARRPSRVTVLPQRLNLQRCSRYKSATFKDSCSALRSARLQSTMIESLSSGKRSMTVRKPTVSP